MVIYPGLTLNQRIRGSSLYRPTYEALTSNRGRFRFLKVAREFETIALRSRVLNVSKSLKKCTKSRRVRRFVTSKATGEMLTRVIPRRFAEILSVSTSAGGLLAFTPEIVWTVR
jgi:hypothetical protein